MMQIIYNFVFYYPLFMAFVFMIGGIVYHFLREPKDKDMKLSEFPLVSILVPCHNEAGCIRETINYLGKQEYPNYEIIAIDDGSTDETGQISESLVKSDKRIRLITNKQNYFPNHQNNKYMVHNQYPYLFLYFHLLNSIFQ